MKSNFVYFLIGMVMGLAIVAMSPFNLLLWAFGIKDPWEKFNDYLDDLVLNNID
jgi:uncharacterized membrane protein YpjA